MKLNFSKVLYGFVVMTLYLIVGIFTLLKFWYFQDEPNYTMVFFGAAVILYGLFRGYRSYIASQIPNDERDENE
jgi:hypothetical protein